MSIEQSQQEDRTKMGDTIALFVGSFNPPTMDHCRAIEAVKASSGINHVWVCPLPGAADPSVRAMVSILSFDMTANGNRVSLCTIALDKKLDSTQAVEWVRTKFPYLNFKVATLAPETVPDSQQTLQVFLGTAGVVAEGAAAVVAEKYAPAPPDIKERIKAGSDESRNFVGPVWDYIQKNKLYRE